MAAIHLSCRQILTLALSMSLLTGPVLSVRADDAPASPQAPTETRILDVALRDGGMLATRVVDLQGNPVVGEPVSVMFEGKVVADAVSDDDGLVVIRGLRPGMHAIETTTSVSACRLWEADAAPPSALKLPAVVADAELIRGQFGAFNLPQIVVLATAVTALVLAIDAESDNEDLEARVRALEAASP